MKSEQKRGLATMAACLAILATRSAQAKHQPVSLDKLPAAVHQTIKEQSAGGTVSAVWQESRDGKTAYGSKIKIKGQDKEVVVDSAGAVVELEEEVPIASLPEAVRKTVIEQSKGVLVQRISRETAGGKVTYEAALTIGGLKGHRKEVEIDPSGAVIGIEEQVALATLPPEVRAGILKAAGKGKVLGVELVTKGTTRTYEARVETAGQTTEVIVGPDGKPIPGDH
ncbi:MAG TPA: hypothetical protein VHQ90_17640 [Thermoanaerobaculia bacterium]|nr:hypothetical protein [Thermoanaerobaculia bacterium]